MEGARTNHLYYGDNLTILREHIHRACLMCPIFCLVMLPLLFGFPNTAMSQQTMPGRLPTSHEVEAQLLGRIAETRRALMTKQIVAGLKAEDCESLGNMMAMATRGRDGGMPIDTQIEVTREFYDPRGRNGSLTNRRLPQDIEKKFSIAFIYIARDYPGYTQLRLGRAVAMDCAQSIPRAASPR